MRRPGRQLMVLFAIGCVTGLPAVCGQTPRAEATDAELSAMSPREMFDDAQFFTTTKPAELEKQQSQVDQRVKERLRKAQRELAAKYVKSLRARGPQVGDDLY